MKTLRIQSYLASSSLSVRIATLLSLLLIPLGNSQALAHHSLKEKLKAKSVLLIDTQTGATLYHKDINDKHYPASTVKLLTALLVWEHTHLKGYVTVKPEDTKVEPSHIPLKVGETVSVKNLTYSLLIGSDNDSGMALARHVAGSVEKFAVLMNKKAKELGCTGSVFYNPHGLPDKRQKVTASDMLKIFTKVLTIPELRKICHTKSFTLKTKARTQTVKNHNKLLGKYPGMGPAKTGWTYASRHTYAASAIRNGRELRLIILNSPNKWDDARLLFDYGFSNLPSAANIASTQTSKPSAKAKQYLDEMLLPLPKKLPQAPAPDKLRLASVSPSAPAPPSATSPSSTQISAFTQYTVKKGDTLYSISKRHGFKVPDILKHNPIDNPNLIKVGMTLNIPHSSSL